MKIMICEDSFPIRELIGAYLKKMGHEVIFAENGLRAIELFQDENPELVLMDVEMPKMSGYEATKIIRQSSNEYSKWTPIIFLSSHIDDESLAKGIEVGGDDYLSKPVSATVLEAKIHAMKRLVLMRANLIELRDKLFKLNEQLMDYNEILSELSLKDPLTGLGNRRAFEEHYSREFKSAIRENTPLCLLMIDVDNFKLYNDTYGHQEGDECLRKIGLTFKTEICRPKDFVARYGGEEFAVILPHSSLSAGKVIAEKMRQGVEALRLKHEKASNPNHIVTISVGIATKQRDDTKDSLIKTADAALYEAKTKGRNKVVGAPFQKGFTLIDILFAIAIIGILAGIAIVNYLDHLVRVKTLELYNLSAPAKIAVVDYRISRKVMPNSNTEAGITSIVSEYATDLSIGSGGVIIITGNQTNLGTGAPFAITLVPTYIDGVVEWQCVASGATQYAPSTCKGTITNPATTSETPSANTSEEEETTNTENNAQSSTGGTSGTTEGTSESATDTTESTTGGTTSGTTESSTTTGGTTGGTTESSTTGGTSESTTGTTGGTTGGTTESSTTGTTGGTTTTTGPGASGGAGNSENSSHSGGSTEVGQSGSSKGGKGGKGGK